MFLLPREYCKILTEDPQLRKYAENADDFGRSLICTSMLSSDQEQALDSEAPPSSGYRSTDSNSSTAGGGYANRPPLPKGILRHPVVQNIKSRKNMVNTKR
jgi:hypothetical protein